MKEKNSRTRVVAFLLAMLLTLTALPFHVFAQESIEQINEENTEVLVTETPAEETEGQKEEAEEIAEEAPLAVTETAIEESAEGAWSLP